MGCTVVLLVVGWVGVVVVVKVVVVRVVVVVRCVVVVEVVGQLVVVVCLSVFGCCVLNDAVGVILQQFNTEHMTKQGIFSGTSDFIREELISPKRKEIIKKVGRSICQPSLF